MGIDPGTADTGYGVVQSVGSRLHALAEGVIQTRPGVPLERRLVDIHATVVELRVNVALASLPEHVRREYRHSGLKS